MRRRGAYREDVAAYDSCFVGWREKGILGDADVNGFEAALVEGNVFGDEAAEAIDYGRVGDGFWSVGVAWNLI